MFAAARIALLLLLAACVEVDSGDLVTVSPEPAGPNCAEGGTRTDIGLDADGDGELADDEIETTSYECDDRGASAGADTDGVGTSP